MDAPGHVQLRKMGEITTKVTGSPANTVAFFLLLPILSLGLVYLVSYMTSSLNKFPGPPLACTSKNLSPGSTFELIHQTAWSNLWRMYHAYNGNMHTATQKMHAKYGPVVRLAPNYIDLDYDKCAGLIKTCFDTKGVWRKVRGPPLGFLLHP